MNRGDTTTVTLGSPDRFGYEWGTYTEVLPESRGQLERWLGSTGLASFRGKDVLDVGCGMSRNPYWMAREGAKSITAVDVDDRSLATARHNLGPFPNATVKKCSVYDLDPVVMGLFDRVTCIGVLHHLADPPRALDALWSCVKPGGDLLLWCYGQEGNRLFIPIIQTTRWFGSRLPLPITHLLAKIIALGAWPVLRFAPWKTNYYANLKTLSFRNVVSIIFDQMIPHIAHYWTREQIGSIVQRLNAEEVWIEHVQGNSWHVRLTRSHEDNGV